MQELCPSWERAPLTLLRSPCARLATESQAREDLALSTWGGKDVAVTLTDWPPRGMVSGHVGKSQGPNSVPQSLRAGAPECWPQGAGGRPLGAETLA